MKNNTLIKKILLSIGTASVIAAPIAIAISCSSLLGSNGKYDSVNDGKIVIQTTWSTGSSQIESLRTIVNKYNDTQKNKLGFMKVVVEKVQGGYGTIPSQAITKIQSEDTRTLPNIYIDYPTAVGMLAPYGMALDVSDEVKRDLFEKQFIEVNDSISGLPTGKLYSVPLSKSTEALSVNKPLLNHLINKALAKYPNQIVVEQDATNNSKIKAIMEQNISDRDKKTIDSEWGSIAKENIEIKYKETSGVNIGKYVINDNIFKYFESLNHFALNIQSLFNAPNKATVLGYDSVTNSAYVINQIKNRNKTDKFLFQKDTKTGFVDYSFLKNGTQSSQDFKDIYKEYFEEPLNSDSIWVGGGGEYGSNLLKEHKMAISLGSTAGLHYATASSRKQEHLNSDEIAYELPIDKVTSKIVIDTEKSDDSMFNWNNVRSIMAQGPSFNTIHINKEENIASKKFMKWFYTSGKEQFDEGIENNLTPVNYFSKKSSYIVPVKGAFDDNSAIASLIKYKKGDEFNKGDNKISVQPKGPLYGVSASFQAMKRMISESKNNDIDYKIINTPIDGLTASIRQMIDSQVNASKNSKNNGDKAYSGEAIWNNLKRQAIIDQIIPDDGSLTNKYIYGNMANRDFSDINWEKYSYVDGYITGWTDGDTPKISVSGKSNHSNLNSIKLGREISIRVAGIDTPESSLKIGDIKYKTGLDSNQKSIYETIDSLTMKKLIDKYKNDKKPLYVKGNFTNEVTTDSSRRYNFWKRMTVSIAAKDANPDDDILDMDTLQLVKKVTNTNDKTFVSSGIPLPIGKFGGSNLISKEVLVEGWYGNKAKQFGLKNIPIGTKVRIATTGAKSFNRYVGSLFYGNNLKNNYSVNIVKSGWAMPLISNPSEVLDKNSIMWHIGQAIADGFNKVIADKKGLFNSGSIDLKLYLGNILLSHGIPTYESLLKNSTTTSIYDYMEIRKPDPTLYKTKGAN